MKWREWVAENVGVAEAKAVRDASVLWAQTAMIACGVALAVCATIFLCVVILSVPV